MIALITDTHFGARGDLPALLDAQEKFYTDVFFPELKKRKVTTILHLGDTFDKRKIINFDTLDRVNKFFFEPLKDFDYHVIVGNHDLYWSNINDVNSPNLLMEENPRWHLYENELAEFEVHGLKIAMCPWINKTNKENLLNSIKKSRSEYLLGHFAIDGFEMMKGRLCEGGLQRELFSHFDSVFSGHFHHPSVYGNIEYLGAPYEMNWSDAEGARGFHLIDPKTRNKTFIQNPFTLHHKLVYSDTDMDLTDLTDLDLSPLAGSFVKIIVKEKKNPYLFEQFMQKISDVQAADVKVLEEDIDLDSVNINDELEEAKDTREILQKYASDIPDVEESVTKQLVSFVDVLYQEALDLQ